MSNLIFDLGFHNGDDTDYYLKKGFSVVAVEANPTLIDAGKIRFENEIENGRLILYHRAFSLTSNYETTFHIHPTNSDWSSCDANRVNWDGSIPIETTVKTICLIDLYRHGCPYYIKTDIEGKDIVMVQDLLQHIDCMRPSFVSFELSKRDYYEVFSYLHVAGYNRFQLVNQRNNDGRIDNSIGHTFSKYSSGMFGEWLPKDRWMTTDQTWTHYMKYKELKVIDNQELALGWVDLHATFKEVIENEMFNL